VGKGKKEGEIVISYAGLGGCDDYAWSHDGDYANESNDGRERVLRDWEGKGIDEYAITAFQ